MANDSDDSSSPGGGAPLYSSPEVQSKSKGKEAAKAKQQPKPQPSSPEAERALVRAGANCNSNGQGMTSNVATVPDTSGRHAFNGAQPPRSATAFQGAGASSFSSSYQPNGNGNVHGPSNAHTGFGPNYGPPGHAYAGSVAARAMPMPAPDHPYLSEGRSIQQMLYTTQQYVKVAPGIPGETSGNVQQRLMSIGQDLNAFIRKLIREQQKGTFQIGELQLQLHGTERELVERKKQIEELHAGMKRVTEERESREREVMDLRQSLGFAKENVKHLQDRIDSFAKYEIRYKERIQSLEDELKNLKASVSYEDIKHRSRMQTRDMSQALVLLKNAPGNAEAQSRRTATVEDDSDGSEDDDPVMRMMGMTKTSKKKTVTKSRRESSLNPEAPTFGPRGSATTSHKGSDYSKELVPMLKSSTSGQLRSTSKNYGPYSEQFLPDRPLTPLVHKKNYRSSYSIQDARAIPATTGKMSRAQSRAMSRAPSNMIAGSSRSRDSSGQNSANPTLPGGGRNPNYDYQKHHGKQLALPNHFSGPPTDLDEWGKFDGTEDRDPAIAYDKEYWEDDDMISAFGRLHTLIQGLVASAHCTSPFREPDSMLPTDHNLSWQYILAMGLPDKTASTAHMFHLMAQPGIRHFVIKRVIIDYLYHRILRPEVFLGFNDKMDSHLMALQERLRSPQHLSGPMPIGKFANKDNSSGRQRQRLVEDRAMLIRQIINTPEGQEFREQTLFKHIDMLFGILRPMRNCTMDDEEARRMVSIACNMAYTISAKVWTSAMSVHYFFPTAGCKFSFGQMISINHSDVPPEQLQYQQWRVMLVVTPTLSIRDERGGDTLRTREITKSNVMVMR